jgi:hypothetical protein
VVLLAELLVDEIALTFSEVDGLVTTIYLLYLYIYLYGGGGRRFQGRKPPRGGICEQRFNPTHLTNPAPASGGKVFEGDDGAKCVK